MRLNQHWPDTYSAPLHPNDKLAMLAEQDGQDDGLGVFHGLLVWLGFSVVSIAAFGVGLSLAHWWAVGR